MKNRERYRGCLIGGAVGDALGYAVEFLDEETIFRRYGQQGITEYALMEGKALISDDTQMTLFTANGLLAGITCGLQMPYVSCIAACYLDWLKTQTAEREGFEAPTCAWLNNVPEMNHRRAPGGTCMSALMYRNLGSTSAPANNSKGCGGVMRVAPVGLYFDGITCTADQMDLLGAEAAALTHGHELGYIPAAMLVHIVHLLANNEEMTVAHAVEDAEDAAARLFPKAAHLPQLLALINTALELAADGQMRDVDAIRTLGEGWVAEEALAIAVYCAAKYESDFEKAVVAAVNHSGDSDSTGAITGNILGARLGMVGIPEKYLHHLELKDTILEIADDLFAISGVAAPESWDETWERKYIRHTYPN